MKRNITYVLFLIVLVGFVVLFVFLLKGDEVSVKASFSPAEEAAYIDDVNVWLDKRQATQDIQNTPKEKSRSKKYWDKMRVITQGQLKNIEFFGKVIDQHGDPVAHVEVSYDAESGYLAEGDGHQKTQTNAQGVFTISGVSGAGLSVYKMLKPGYQFDINHVKNFDNYQRFPNSNVWSEYSELDKAYIFHGWKVERYAKLVTRDGGYLFVPNDKIYSVDLTKGSGKNKHEGANKGSFNVSFVRSDESWQLTLVAPNGGFIETEDVYMNTAPDSGYQESILLSGPYDKKKLVIRKKYYLKSQQGEYARIAMEIRPYFKKKSFIKLNYAVNIGGTKSLVSVLSK